MKKKQELSFLNVLFCLLVIFIHVAAEPASRLDRMSAEYAIVLIPWRLSAFVVQGFIFLSGLKMFLHESGKGYFSYIGARLKSVALPYFVCVLCYYAYFQYKGGYFEPNLRELAAYILNGTLVSHLYFVVVIMQFYLLKPLWKRFTASVPPLLGITASLIVTLVCVTQLPLQFRTQQEKNLSITTGFLPHI